MSAPKTPWGLLTEQAQAPQPKPPSDGKAYQQKKMREYRAKKSAQNPAQGK